MKNEKIKHKKLKSYFTEFFIRRFVPDYYDIKSENEQLKRDIYSLIRKENEIEGITAKMLWKIRLTTDELMFCDLSKDHVNHPL
jgi:hypothetical protein